MAKSTKYFDLFSALKAGGNKGVSPEALQKATGFTTGALAVYIHALRNKFGAQIESVRNGRTVTAYRLTNADAVAITAARKKRTVVAKSKPTKKVPVPMATRRSRTPFATASVVKSAKTVREDGSVPVLDSDLDIAEIGINELNDIRHSLGI